MIKYMLFDVIFRADSEYHVYFERKSVCDCHNPEIGEKIGYQLLLISKELIFSTQERNFKKSETYFCCSSDDDSNGI